MKIIGITMRTDFIAERNEVRDCLDQKFMSILHARNILPILLPNNAENFTMLCDTVEFDGFILSGGNDSESRDALENAVIEYSIATELPILGICHGFQKLNKYFGGTHESKATHVNKVHSIHVSSKYFGDSFEQVNSYHENIITQNSLSQYFDTIAVCTIDNTVEAAMHQEHKILGIMWHPERANSSHTLDDKIFRYLLQ